MTTAELRQLIELHNAYDKHMPIIEWGGIGTFNFSISVCRTCGTPLRTTDGCAKVLEYEPELLGVLTLQEHYPSVFQLFLSTVKAQDLSQAWMGLLLEDSGGGVFIWQVIRRLGIPAEDLLVEYFDNDIAAMVAKAMIMPAEIKRRAYNIIIKSDNVKAMYDYCTRILNHTDAAMLAAADAAASRLPAEQTLTGMRTTIEQFNEWYFRHLTWERTKEATK